MTIGAILFHSSVIVMMGVTGLTGLASTTTQPQNGPGNGSGEAGFADRVEAMGQTRRAIERAAERLCSPPLSDPEFVLSDVHFRLTRRFTEYSGDISGRMLSALQAAGLVLNRQIPMAETLAAAFAQYQQPDGHFGADQDLAAGVQQGRDMPILWGNGRLLLALAERYRLKPDPQLLAMARRLGDYMVSTRPYYGKKENFERVGGAYASGYTTCYPSSIDGLTALGEISGDAKVPPTPSSAFSSVYCEEARFIARLSLLDRQFEKHHSHGRLTAYRGMLDLDRLTGTREFTDVLVTDCARIREGFMLPTGGITETFDRTDIRDEGCTEADWVRVNLLLWQATADPAYLDMAECVLRNHLLATQFSNGGFGHHVFRLLREGGRVYPGGGIGNMGAESYWCCAMHGTQVLADAARWSILVGRDNRVLITWLGEARSTLKVGGKSLTVAAEQAEPGVWKLSLESQQPIEVVLALRVPGWAKGIEVDGQMQVGQSGWVEVPCKCSGSLSLNVKLPREIRLAGAYGHELKTWHGLPIRESQPAIRQAETYGHELKAGEPVRVFASADLFCLADAHMSEGLLAEDAVPTIKLAATEPVGGEIPVVVQGSKTGKECFTRLVSMCHRPPGGCRYLFNVQRVNAGEFRQFNAPFRQAGVPIELVFACDGTCDLYLNGRHVGQRTGCIGDNARIEVYARQGANVLAVRAYSESARPALIGMVRVGDRWHVTDAQHWSAVACPTTLPADWLTDPARGPQERVAIDDLGVLGVEPWRHVPAEFAQTGAHWIWPSPPAPDKNVSWLLRYRFDVP